MKKLILFICTLLMINSSFATGNKITFNARSIANTILNVHSLSSKEKGSFAIVYGGQDISRSSVNYEQKLRVIG